MYVKVLPGLVHCVCLPYVLGGEEPGDKDSVHSLRVSVPSLRVRSSHVI